MSAKTIYTMAVVWTLTCALACITGSVKGSGAAGMIISAASAWFHLGRMSRLPGVTATDDERKARKWGRQ